LQEQILDAALAEVLSHGWRGLRMQVVAAAVGVSRQTVHTEFATKRGLASALIFRATSAYLDEEERMVARSSDMTLALRDTVRFAFELATTDQLLKLVISPDARDMFLPLYTSDAAPLVAYISSRMATAFAFRWPHLDDERLRTAMTTVTRLVISHILLPLQPPGQVAHQIAEMISDYLTR
jgi:AcrR family transcriptional regulator